MVAGRHLENRLEITISQQRFDRAPPVTKMWNSVRNCRNGVAWIVTVTQGHWKSHPSIVRIRVPI